MNTSNKRTPKLLSLLLVVCMVLSLLPMAALAAETDIPIDEAHFPDEEFRTYVLENCDTDKNAVLSAAEAAAVTEINLYNDPTLPPESQVSSLQGIEFFTQLTKLNCYYNKLTSLDVSKNPELTELNCAENQLTSLDVSHNPKLTSLGCGYNQLTSLDVSHNPNLTEVWCSGNQLTSLDVSMLSNLEDLSCLDNQLTSLDVSHNPKLTSLDCSYNQLTSLDVSKNPNLAKLTCLDNQLTSLDISNNTNLEALYCWRNQITSLDVSKNLDLIYLVCFDNQLTSLDVSNNLNLTDLACGSNQLSSLDVSNNLNLTHLNCESNQLSSLDVSKNTRLTELGCGHNQLSSLDVSMLSDLENLYCRDNQLTSLDVSMLPNLDDLYCLNNQLTNLDVSHNPELFELDCSSNQLTSLDLSNNPDLYSLKFANNKYTVNQRKNITLPGNFDASKVSNVVGGKFDTAKNTFSFDAGVNEATYEYVTGYTGTNVLDHSSFKLVYDGPTEPTPTEPKPTQPKPTEPKPTEPHTHKFGDWVITKEPTSTTEGEETRTCSCGKKETRKIPKLSNPFKDISADEYFYEPVLWAVNKKITAGVSENNFGAALPCTRGQIATFLWAAAGKPEPKSTKNPFTDVTESDYYYKAVLWAVENGITSGMSADKFGPNVTCTRAQTVTFLWAAEGKPKVNSNVSFSDVVSSDYYYNAVKWAVENKVTAGVGGDRFGPSQDCLRGQIVTFLYMTFA